MWLAALRIYQIAFVRLFGSTMVEPEIIPAGNLEALVPEDLLNVADRAAVKQQLRSGGMTEQMRRDRLANTRQMLIPRKGRIR